MAYTDFTPQQVDAYIKANPNTWQKAFSDYGVDPSAGLSYAAGANPTAPPAPTSMTAATAPTPAGTTTPATAAASTVSPAASTQTMGGLLSSSNPGTTTALQNWWGQNQQGGKVSGVDWNGFVSSAPNATASTATSIFNDYYANPTADAFNALKTTAYGDLSSYVTPPALRPATPTAYTPALATQTQWQVTPDQTVAGLINQYTSPSNPLVQTAVTRALESQNARGLLNSSMSTTAGQLAAYEAALPIAQADAQTYGASAQFNAGQANSLAIQNANAQNTAAQFSTDWANKFVYQNADNATKTRLADIEANYKGLMQTSASAADLYSKTLALMTSVMQDPNMDAASKQTALNNQVASLSTGLNLIGSLNGVNVGSLLKDF